MQLIEGEGGGEREGGERGGNTFLIIDQLSSTSGVKLCIEYQLLLKTLNPADLN